jgi:oligoribonuclease NrnB/cAMP/cGMP phosphodiesterase (DHH superfamily)
MSKVYIVHHSADFDGAASAIVTAAGLGLDRLDPETKKIGFDENLCKFIPYNYGNELTVKVDEEFVNLVDVLENDDWVFFVDCSYTKDVDTIKKMIQKIGTPEQVVLIDHHETSIEWFSKNCPEINMKGSQSSSQMEDPISAAAMCWKFFNENENYPIALELISKYDTWNRNDGKWDITTLPYQYGLRSYGYDLKNIKHSFHDIYSAVFSDEKTVNEIIEKGNILLDKIKADAKLLIRSYSKDAWVSINGTRYFAKIGPGHLQNSTLFEYGLPQECQDRYDIFILERPDMMRGNAIISIISNKDEIDASTLCEALGGGGHKKIGGCVVTYNNTVYDKENNVWMTTLKKYEE